MSLQNAIDKIKGDPLPPENWYPLITTLVLQGNVPSVVNALNQRLSMAKDAADILFVVLMEMEIHNSVSPRFYENYPKDHPTLPVTMFVNACRKLRNGEWHEGWELFDRAAQFSSQVSDFFNGENCNVVLIGDIFCFDIDNILYNENLFKNFPYISNVNSINNDNPLFFISCDTQYFHKFENVIFSLLDRKDVNQVHLHLSDHNQEVMELLKNIQRNKFPNFGFSSDSKIPENSWLATTSGYKRAVYYASNRFIKLFDIMKIYPRNEIFVCDCDDNIEINLQSALVAKNYDVGLTFTENMRPWLTCLAALTHIRPTTDALLFSETLRKYLMHSLMLAAPWGIDQAALFNVSGYLAKKGEITLASLPDIIGEPYGHFFKSNSTAAEKQKMRRNAQ